jgi:putative transposase
MVMPGKFRNKYRIESNRLKRWDYSSPGYYFITLVTQNRVCNLGRVVGAKYVELSDFGKITDAEWHKSFEIRSELFLDEYIIMPNHIHAIVDLETHGRASIEPTAFFWIKIIILDQEFIFLE